VKMQNEIYYELPCGNIISSERWIADFPKAGISCQSSKIRFHVPPLRSAYNMVHNVSKRQRGFDLLSRSPIQDDVTAARFLLKWTPNVWATLEFSVKAKVTARVSILDVFRGDCIARKVRGKGRFERGAPRLALIYILLLALRIVEVKRAKLMRVVHDRVGRWATG
jgi:hypothetical protein